MTDGDAVSQRALIESDITELVIQALGGVGPRGVERGMEFRALGLDSQSIVALIATVERQFGIQFGLDTPPEAFTSIAQLSGEVLKLRATGGLSEESGVRVLVTGATGSVGVGLVLELLACTSAEVVCLVRGHDDKSAQQRLHSTLVAATSVYDCAVTMDAIRTRCHAVVGDVSAPGCGVEDPARVGAIDELWHLAASLRYLDKHEASIRAVNVEGTRQALALARELGVDVFNHASTIGTAGARSGVHYEVPVVGDEQMNNAYERSKRDAEYLVSEAGIVTARIMRLPIIIGHSRTHAMAASTLSGIYTLVDEMRRFRTEVEDRLGSYLEHYGVQVIADPHARNAALPVDRVAQAMVTLSLRGAESGFYTIGNMDSGNAGGLMAGIADALGICEPRYVQDRAMLTSIDQMFTDKLRFHAPYLMQDHLYDCSNLLRYVDSEVISFSLTREVLGAYARLSGHGQFGLRRRC